MSCNTFRTIWVFILIALLFLSGCTIDRWIGVYEIPKSDEVGIVKADLKTWEGKLFAKVRFKNKTFNFHGRGHLKGEIKDTQFTLSGTISDEIHGKSTIKLAGTMVGDQLEGTYTQILQGQSITGNVVLVKTSQTTYYGWWQNNQITNSGQQLIDLGGASPGLLGPGRPNVYGPGLHADATGRPFSWRTQDGSMSFGSVKSNGYGLGVGMDSFGRPVRAVPRW